MKLFVFIFLGVAGFKSITSNEASHQQNFIENLDDRVHLGPGLTVFWLINQEENTIYFEAVAETNGYVLFGLNPKGGMDGADIFIFGSYRNGTSYSLDCHADSNGLPIEDQSTDWILDNVTDSYTIHFSFHRLLNTCDDKDVVITDSPIKIIWALGDSHNIELPLWPENRGTHSVDFYHPNIAFNLPRYSQTDITVEIEMPAEPTTYWCTIHRLPTFTEKRHIVAFENIMGNYEARLYTHHYVLHRCEAPEGLEPDELFGQWIEHPGDICYGQSNVSIAFTKYCSGNMVFTSTRDFTGMIFPDGVGLPLTDDVTKPVYFALEVRYDNPNRLTGKNVVTGGRIYHTDSLRPVEAGLMAIEHHKGVQLTIPPHSSDYVVSGHCSSECIQQFIPLHGISIFSTMFNAHSTAKKIKLRHFIGEQEIEWIDTNDYYDFDFQYNQQFSDPRRIQRGDQLTVECTYDTMKVDNDMGVIGGERLHEEKCQAWVYYYPKLENLETCRSAQDLDKHFELLGITEAREQAIEYPGGLKEWVIVKPDQLAGNYLDGVSKKINWTDEFRARYQQEKRFGEQIGTCGTRLGEGGISWTVKYPENLKEYIPRDECNPGTDPPTTEPPTEPPTTKPATTEPPTTEPPTEPPTTEPATTEPPTTGPATTEPPTTEPPTTEPPPTEPPTEPPTKPTTTEQTTTEPTTTEPTTTELTTTEPTTTEPTTTELTTVEPTSTPPEVTTPKYDNCTQINNPVVKLIVIANSSVEINM